MSSDGLLFLWTGIANSLDLTDRVLPRLHTKARCRPKLLHFAPYSRNEIAAILDNRLAKVYIAAFTLSFTTSIPDFV